MTLNVFKLVFVIFLGNKQRKIKIFDIVNDKYELGILLANMLQKSRHRLHIRERRRYLLGGQA